ncbi:Uncharacterised protein [Metamycoplasma arthritidis]|uniref:Hypothetical lipoprotein n=1 Tax=Metamycoplasma arthritidis (strain 158L3-1) TaxID=243272 RepID=B3PLX7_META1|nr:hypothetical protein [Metamycoplasma arthritidis]ACF07029.1 hypothetical lipoprotein [Metamycoplasma arthritidis 158L3-1]VEU78557.1 Uncharacterised protein [Metamycoplasma arthritidis]
MKKRLLLISSMSTAAVTLSLLSVSCVKLIPEFKPEILNSSQLQTIRESFVFKRTEEGKKLSIKELHQIMKKARQASENPIEFKNNKELRKYIILDFVDVNSIADGHTMKIFDPEYDPATDSIKFRVLIGCDTEPRELDEDFWLDKS